MSKIAFAGHPSMDLGPEVKRAGSVWTREVARRLAPAHEAVIFGGRPGRSTEEIHEGLRYVPVSFPTPLYLKPFGLTDRLSDHPRLIGRLFGSPAYFPRYAFRVARYLRRERADVVHLHNFFQAIPLIRFCNPKIAIVLHMHTEWLSGISRKAGASFLREADLILACSDYVKQTIDAAHPSFADRVRTLHNGVDPLRFTPKPRRTSQRVIYVGRISPEKGPHVLVEAMKLVVSACPRALLEIVGPDAQQPRHYLTVLGNRLLDPSRPGFAALSARGYAQRLRAAATELGANVELNIRYASHEELNERFSDAALLVAPSLSETFGMTAVEAMASGLPVVASRVGGIPEVVADGTTGFLVPPNDPAALAQAIITLLRDEQARNSMANAARKLALERFSWDRIVEQYREALHSFISIGKDCRQLLPLGNSL